MVGRTILQYQFLEKLGAGGMGEIFKAQDTRLNRFVAIKVLTSAATGDPDRRRRFIQEAQAASALNHPNIITIHDIVSEGGTDFMVMEYVAGKTLVDVIPNGGLRGSQVLKYSVQMADALQAAHNAGIVHRDLKPGNVMVTESGLIKVLDFGLAKLTDRGPLNTFTGPSDATQTMADAPLTVEGSIIGTVSYMSPEQAQGKKVDTRSDIFSFGVVLYEMVTGKRAFEGDSTLTTLSAILRDEVRPVAEFAPEAPPQLEQVIRRCLRKTPDERWQTMKDVQMALAALKHESDSGMLHRARLADTPSRVSVKTGGGKKKGPPVAILAGVLGAVVLAAVGGGLWWKHHKEGQATAEQAAVQTAPDNTAPAPPATPPLDTPPPDATATPNPPLATDEAMTNEQIIQMVDGKVSPNVIIGQIRASKTNFILTPAEVIRLSKAGVPDNVIEAMRNPKRGAPPPGTPTLVSGSPSASSPLAPGKTAPKQDATPPAQPTAAAQPQQPAPAPAPAASQAAPGSAANSAPKTTAPSVQPAPVPPANSKTVTVKDGTPFKIVLAEDIPETAEEGRPLRFTVSEDVRDGDAVLIAKGAAATGVIGGVPGKKILGVFGGGKLTFKLASVTAVDGHKLNIRAVQAHGADGSYRPVELPGVKPKSKDLAASAGVGEYIAYVEGDQTVSTHK